MKRKKPLPWRNAKRRPPAEASAQREAVMERSVPAGQMQEAEAAIRAAEAEREARGLAVVKMVVP